MNNKTKTTKQKKSEMTNRILGILLGITAVFNIVSFILNIILNNPFGSGVVPANVVFLALLIVIAVLCVVMAIYTQNSKIDKARVLARALVGVLISATVVRIYIGGIEEIDSTIVLQLLLVLIYQLHNDPNRGKVYVGEDKKGKEKPVRGRMPLSFYNLFWIFMIGSVVGLIGETIVAFFTDGFFKDRTGLLWGPFSPIYGLGAVLMTVFLDRLWNKNIFLIFLVGALVGATFEFAVGWFLETSFGIVAWDYSDQLFNIMGHTSLRLAFIWGILGVVWVMLGVPSMQKLVNLIPLNARTTVTIVVFALMVFNGVMTLLAFDHWFQRETGEPVATQRQEFFAEHFDNDFMKNRFQTMSMWTDLSSRSGL